jgi:hypothetical protein
MTEKVGQLEDLFEFLEEGFDAPAAAIHLLSPDCQQIKSIPDGKDFFSV